MIWQKNINWIFLLYRTSSGSNFQINLVHFFPITSVLSLICRKSSIFNIVVPSKIRKKSWKLMYIRRNTFPKWQKQQKIMLWTARSSLRSKIRVNCYRKIWWLLFINRCENSFLQFFIAGHGRPKISTSFAKFQQMDNNSSQSQLSPEPRYASKIWLF